MTAYLAAQAVIWLAIAIFTGRIALDEIRGGGWTDTQRLMAEARGESTRPDAITGTALFVVLAGIPMAVAAWSAAIIGGRAEFGVAYFGAMACLWGALTGFSFFAKPSMCPSTARDVAFFAAAAAGFGWTISMVTIVRV